MIHGIGTDIVRIARLEQSLARFGETLARRILADTELPAFQASRQPARLLAKRFAAKEAVAKALGTGFRDGLILPQIAIEHDAAGRPLVRYHGRAAQLVAQLGIADTLLSLSDEQDYAVAFALLLKGPAAPRQAGADVG
ncbi:MAG TPA: holo-ACP synthase [Candidatus Competibacteraceae bacterium]|nr:holo-ACP synthase [Candidatus Competibacteraceae bacterium]